MNMTPPPCATVEKNPLRIRNAMKALNVVEPAQPAAVQSLSSFCISVTAFSNIYRVSLRGQGEPEQDWESAKVR